MKILNYILGVNIIRVYAVFCLALLLFVPRNVGAENLGVMSSLPQEAQQNSAIKGKIVDENGEPLIGVTVKARGTKNAAITDLEGNFTITAKPGGQLEISYIGYLTQVVKASTGFMNISMKPDVTGLDDVVVIGYGSVKKRDLTGAISSVKAEDIKQTPAANAMEGLAGKISGLDIVRESGRAGTSPTILLRGNRSLNADCSPLYIIDGVAGSIDNINPNDIESIEVLKDASSTAIYGSAGANGVIIVTTKQGTSGKIQIDFDAYVGINAFPSYPSTLMGDSWIDFLTEGYVARYDAQPSDMNELFNAIGMTQGAIAAYDNNEWINWKDEILHTGIEQNYNISLRGGSDRQQSYFSGGFLQEKGIYKHDQSNMLTFRAGTTYKLNRNISVGFQSTLTYKNRDRRNSRLNKSLNQIPLGKVYNDDGSLNYYPISDMTNYVNILADDELNAYQNNTKNTYINIAPFVEITIIKGLTFKSLFSGSLSHQRQGIWDGLDTYMKLTGSSENKRTASYGSYNGYSYTWQNVANYNFQIKNDHDITFTGIIEYTDNRNENATAQNEQFQYDDFLWYNLSAGLQAYTSSSYSETKKMSYALRASYSYLGRYLLSVSTRWDGASQLYHKWSTFPAFAVGWRVSDEPFMNGTRSWLDNLKIRVGYGITGNANIDPYVSLTAVTNSANYINLGSGQIQSYILAQNVANYDLTWEKSYNWNLGLDFAVLNGRIDGSIELYDTQTKGVLYNRPIPTSFGGYNAKSPYYKMSNIAKIANKGVEVTLNTRNIDLKNFKWNSTITFSTNDEKLKSIDMGNNVTVDDLIALNLFVGEPVGTFYGYKKVGIWQLGQEDMAACFGSVPGEVRLDVPGLVYDKNYTYTTSSTSTDANGETVTTYTTHYGAYYKPSEDEVDANGNVVHSYYTSENNYVVSASDKQILGHKTPDWSLGFNNTFYFYNFDVTVNMLWRWGQMINGELLGYWSTTNIPDCYDYWTPTNPSNAYPRPNQGSSMTDAQNSSLNYTDGSFFKVKNITIGYSIPTKALKKINMSRLRVYATITNPFILCKSDMLKGMDPENSASDSFPLYKTLVFGLNASF